MHAARILKGPEPHLSLDVLRALRAEAGALLRFLRSDSRFEIIENLGAIDPDEAMVPSAAEFGRGPIA